MIRPLKASDRAPIEEMVRATGVFVEEEVAVALELVDHALASATQTDYIFFVYDDGATRGYACCGQTPMTEATWDLYWIVVHPNSFGKGVGRALTHATEEYIREHGGKLIIVETSSKPSYDRTRKFYVDAGYVQLSEIVNYYRVNDNLVVYGKYFK